MKTKPAVHVKQKRKGLSGQARAWRFLAIFTGVVMLAMRSPAPTGPPESISLSISQQGANTVTIIARNAPADTPETLQMSTDLTTSNWMDRETNTPGMDG